MPAGPPLQVVSHGISTGTTRLTRLSNFSRKVSLAGIEPVGFRVKSDLRNHQAIVQPRLYDMRNHQAIVQPRTTAVVR